MANELARLCVGGRETQSDKYVIQTALELCQQVFTGHALLANRFLEIGAKLIFEHAVDTFHLLFFAQLQAVADDLRLSIVAVLPRREIPLFDSAGRFETA